MNQSGNDFNAATQEVTSKLANQAVDKTEQAINATRTAVNNTASRLNDGLDQLQDTSASAVNYAADQAEQLARKGLAQARRANTAIRETVQSTGDRAVDFIRNEPIKSVLYAAAVGALLATVLGRRPSER